MINSVLLINSHGTRKRMNRIQAHSLFSFSGRSHWMLCPIALCDISVYYYVSFGRVIHRNDFAIFQYPLLFKCQVNWINEIQCKRRMFVSSVCKIDTLLHKIEKIKKRKSKQKYCKVENHATRITSSDSPKGMKICTEYTLIVYK